MRVLLLNGPNLNLLGTRRPEVYGTTTLPALEEQVRGWAADLGVAPVEAHQSNHEGVLIDRIHAAREDGVDGIILNPGAYTHSSYALHDAIEAVEIPTVEVHISDVEHREDWRRVSVIRPACTATIYGRGVEGYRWALRHLVARAAAPVQHLRYGDSPEHVADLRLPEGEGPHPLVVLVHGGFWRHQWTRDTVDLVAVDLVRRGLAVLVPEYRRVGRAGGDGGGARSVDDVVAATAAGLAAAGVDQAHWAVAGHSAGGQLALMAARALSVDPETSPRLAVSLAGAVDLEGAIRDGLGDGAASAYVGAADPRALSPTALVPLGVPTLLAHGRADELVPIRQSETHLAAARAAGDEVELLAGDHDHFAYLEPASAAWQAVAERLVAALR